jgi:peptidoglycan/LPS O-acetylase OafA/YrhL
MEFNAKMSISSFLEKENNNLDLFRIMAAIMVILGHSYVLFPNLSRVDPVFFFTGFTYSGPLAVKIFFFISGLVVTNSAIRQDSFTYFVVSRIFRIFPALIFLCLVTVFIVGPLVTTLPVSEYLSSPITHRYLNNNIVLDTQYKLPGVFASNHYPDAVNGSLWTLPHEVGCYLLLLAFLSMGILKNRIVSSVLFGLVILDVILPERILTYWNNANPEVILLPSCFAAGALLALNKEKIGISFSQTIGLSILTYILWDTKFVELFFCFTVFSLILCLAKSPVIKSIRIRNDISYGIYLWGFLVQQVVQHIMVGYIMSLKTAISLVLSIALGALSWYLIEKRFIGYGKRLTQGLKLRFGNE